MYNGNSIWNICEEAMKEIILALSTNKFNVAEDILWLFYRNAYTPTEIPKIEHPLLNNILESMKTNDDEKIRNEVLNSIKTLRLNDVDRIIYILDHTDLIYKHGKCWHRQTTKK